MSEPVARFPQVCKIRC